MFSIIAFTSEDDNSVAYVPTSWLIGRTFCLWPEASHAVTESLRQSCVPPQEDWQRHPCRILGSATTLAEALRKAKRGEDTSNVESDPNQPRRRSPPRRLMQECSTAKSRRIATPSVAPGNHKPRGTTSSCKFVFSYVLY
jgi:hypothetical protein